MRILHLIPNLSSGGAERQLSYLAPELVRRGHEVHIAYSKKGPSKIDLPGVVLHQLKSWSNYDPYLIWQLQRITRSFKPEIIHTWILQMDILGGIVAKFNRIPFIFREPNQVLAYPPNWKNRFRVWVASGANAIVSNSHGGEEYWKMQLPHSCRYVVVNALPLLEIDKAPTALPSGMVETGRPMALYVGRVIAYKNLKPFIEAMALVKQRQDVLGVVCGHGPQLSELKVFVQKLGMEKDIYFSGHLSSVEVWGLMKKATIFVSLSEHEGRPNTVMESMACVCPVVLSDIPAHREILDKSSALFVDPSNIQQVADTILQALSDHEASKNRALIAKQKTQEWSIVEMAKSYERIYKEFI